MQVDSAASRVSSQVSGGAAAQTCHGAGSASAEASFAGLVVGKLAVRGHARLVARALWHAMRPHAVPIGGADNGTDVADASKSAGTAPSAVTWAAPASLGPAGASAAAAWSLRCRVVCLRLIWMQLYCGRRA